MAKKKSVTPKSTSLNLKDIKKGQVFYECRYGLNMIFTAAENARIDDTGMTRLMVHRKTGQMIEMSCGKDLDYFLKLSTEPAFVKIVDGVETYPTI